MPKQRVHNEYFDTVSLGNRKSCPECSAKLNGGLIFAWYEYVRVQRRLIQYFCAECWPAVEQRLVQHASKCGCTFELQWKGCFQDKPDWLVIPPECKV